MRAISFGVGPELAYSQSRGGGSQARGGFGLQENRNRARTERVGAGVGNAGSQGDHGAARSKASFRLWSSPFSAREPSRSCRASERSASLKETPSRPLRGRPPPCRGRWSLGHCFCASFERSSDQHVGRRKGRFPETLNFSHKFVRGSRIPSGAAVFA